MLSRFQSSSTMVDDHHHPQRYVYCLAEGRRSSQALRKSTSKLIGAPCEEKIEQRYDRLLSKVRGSYICIVVTRFVHHYSVGYHLVNRLR